MRLLAPDSCARSALARSILASRSSSSPSPASSHPRFLAAFGGGICGAVDAARSEAAGCGRRLILMGDRQRGERRPGWEREIEERGEGQAAGQGWSGDGDLGGRVQIKVRGLLVPPCLLCRLPHASAFIYGDADAVMSFRIVLDGAVFGTACLLPAALGLAGARQCDARAQQQRAPDAVARALGSGAGTGGGRHVLLPGAAWSCPRISQEIYSPFFNRNHTAF